MAATALSVGMKGDQSCSRFNAPKNIVVVFGSAKFLTSGSDPTAFGNTAISGLYFRSASAIASVLVWIACTP